MKLHLHLLALLCSALSASAALSATEDMGSWEELPLPGDGEQPIGSLGLEPGGDLWAVIGGELLNWAGDGFRAPLESAIPPGFPSPFLVGGGDRPLYAARQTGVANRGELYLLSDACAIFAAEYYQENASARPSVHVSRSGRIFNWGDRFLAVFEDGAWTRVEARLSDAETLVLETSHAVHFLFDRELYSVGADGRIDHRELDCAIPSEESRKRVHGALLGDDLVVRMENGAQSLCVHRLDTGERVELGWVEEFFAKRAGHDLFRAGGGAVWISVHEFDRGFALWEIAPDGSLREASGSRRFDWRNLRHGQYPQCVLAGADGSTWLGTLRDGVVHCREGEVERFDWRSGLDGEFRRLLEGPRGTVYAASSKSLFRFDPAGEPRPAPAWSAQWEEHALASSQPLRDGAGNLWMFLAERPGELSRWDGEAWTHLAVPFNTRAVGRMLLDDRGHALVAMTMHSDGCWDVGPDGSERRRDLRQTIAAAVAGGARQFHVDHSLQGCVVDADGRIWFGYQGHGAVNLFDGERWDELTWSEPIYWLALHPRAGILFRTQSGRFLGYDRGQLRELAIDPQTPERLLLGGCSFLPFDPELARDPRTLPLERGSDGELHVLAPVDETADAPSSFELGDALPRSVQILTPAFHGGHWSRFPREELFRFFGGRTLRTSSCASPLLDREASREGILEDRVGDLWVDAGTYFGVRSVFRLSMDAFEIHADVLPSRARRTLTIDAQASFAGELLLDAPLFWRLDRRPWRGGTPRTATIAFPGVGRYEVELIALATLGGRTPRPLRWTVDVEIPLPDTLATDDGPFACDDIAWRIPARAVPSEPGAAPRLLVRFDGEDWSEAHRGDAVLFDGRDAGVHRVQVAACEGERELDPTPLSFELRFAPDPAAIVARRLDAWADLDPASRAAALLELRAAGPLVLPALRERFDAARRAAELAELLEALIGVLEVDRDPDRLACY